MKYLLDTNVLVHMANQYTGYRRITKRLYRLNPGDAVLSAITAHEIQYQLKKGKASQARLNSLASEFAVFKIIPFNAGAALAAAVVRAHLEETGRKIGLADTLIAGHAKYLGLACVTDNTGEFDRVPGLAVENWLRGAGR